MLPAFSPAFEIGLLEGVEARTAELGLNLIVRRTHGRQDVEEQVIDALMNSELVDGLIVFAVNGDYYNRRRSGNQPRLDGVLLALREPAPGSGVQRPPAG